MTAPNYSINYSAQVLAASAPISVGDVLIPDASGSGAYVKATAANRTTRRSDGIALTPYSGTADAGVVAIQQVGKVDSSVTGLGAGAASWVRTSATGVCERCTPAPGDDILGWCEADGSLHLFPGFVTSAIALGGGSVPTGTGFTHITAGVQDAASKTVDLGASADVTVPGSDQQLLCRSSGVVAGTANIFTDGNYVVFLPVGALGPSAGFLRFPSGASRQAITVHNGVATNINIVQTDSAAQITTIGDSNWYLDLNGFQTRIRSNSVAVAIADSTNGLAVQGALPLTVATGWFAMGTTPATAGDVRLKSGFVLQVRNSLNTANIQVIQHSGTANEYIQIGELNNAASGDIQLRTSGAQVCRIMNGVGGNFILAGSSTNVLCGMPVIGDSGQPSPFAGMNGMFVKSMAGSTYTLAASEYCYSIIKVTGSGVNTIKLPAATDAGAYMKFVWNAGSSTLQVQDTNSVGAAATLGTGTGAWFLFANGAVKQLSAAFTVA